MFTELLDKTDPAISDGEIETGEECKMFATLLQKFTGRPTEGQGATGDDDSTVDALMEWVIGAAVSKEVVFQLQYKL